MADLAYSERTIGRTARLSWTLDPPLFLLFRRRRKKCSVAEGLDQRAWIRDIHGALTPMTWLSASISGAIFVTPSCPPSRTPFNGAGRTVEYTLLNPATWYSSMAPLVRPIGS